jgi:hypothetical protein
MKRVFLLLAVTLMFALAASAQDTSTAGTSTPAGTKGAMAHSMHSHSHGDTNATSGSSSGGGASLTGCLNGPNAENAYLLTNARFKKGVEVGMAGSDDLSKHVGHKVKLTGSWAKSGAEIGENEGMEKNEGAAKGEKKEKGEAHEKHFKVEKIDHIADSCTMGGSGNTGAMTQKSSKGAITAANTDDKMTKKAQEQQKKQQSSTSTPK